MNNIVLFVDGRVNVGKSTFIDVFTATAYSIFDNIIVIREPLNRNITGAIVEDIGYDNLLKFIISRKDNLIVESITDANHNADLYHMSTLIIVERSFIGDLIVRGLQYDEQYSSLLKSLRCYNHKDNVEFVHLLIHESAHVDSDVYSEHDSLSVLYDTYSSKFNRIERPVGDDYFLDLTMESVNFCKHLLWLRQETQAD